MLPLSIPYLENSEKCCYPSELTLWNDVLVVPYQMSSQWKPVKAFRLIYVEYMDATQLEEFDLQRKEIKCQTNILKDTASTDMLNIDQWQTNIFKESLCVYKTPNMKMVTVIPNTFNDQISLYE